MRCRPANTPAKSTANWFLLPPSTQEVQFDEKWAFVGKKQKRCDPANPDDQTQGDNWDHVAFDPEHRLVLSVVPGKRTAANLYRLIADAQQRTEFRPLRLLVSDEYRPYFQAMLERYGVEVLPKRRGPGRPPSPTLQPDKDLVYATVHKTRRRGRVVRVEPRRVFGTARQLQKALLTSPVSRTVNLAFVERHNATDRHRNARKGRRTYRFSKDWEVHNAMTYFTMYSYNFCWPVRTLRRQDAHGRWQPHTPAMAAGIDDHIWSLREWATYPAFQLE